MPRQRDGCRVGAPAASLIPANSERRRPGDPNSVATYRHDIANLQCLTVVFEQLGHQCNTPLRGNIRESDESRMLDIVHKDEFPEIGVDGHQNPLFGIRTFEQRPIARVGTKLASFENVVSLRELPACAPIDEKSHRSATVTADRVSLAIIACA